MTTHDSRGREFDARLGRANEQIGRLREATDRSGNVVHFRMARYLESLHELVVDLNERSKRMPPADTYERRKFERDLGSLEDKSRGRSPSSPRRRRKSKGTPARRCGADIRLLEVEAEAAEERVATHVSPGAVWRYRRSPT